jgi:hypothetical protein
VPENGHQAGGNDCKLQGHCSIIYVEFVEFYYVCVREEIVRCTHREFVENVEFEPKRMELGFCKFNTVVEFALTLHKLTSK